jgi:H+/Cl- antiporter ClcA
MRKKILEESVIFISIIKWFFLASIVGIMVGASTTVFLKGLDKSIAVTNQFKYYFLLLPVAFFLSNLFIKYLAPEAEGHGTEKVIEAVNRRSGKINPMVHQTRCNHYNNCIRRLSRQGRALRSNWRRAFFHLCISVQIQQ